MTLTLTLCRARLGSEARTLILRSCLSPNPGSSRVVPAMRDVDVCVRARHCLQGGNKRCHSVLYVHHICGAGSSVSGLSQHLMTGCRSRRLQEQRRLHSKLASTHHEDA